MERNNRRADRANKHLNRRSVLKAGATGLAALAASGNVLAMNTDSKQASDVYVAKGTIDNPISEAQREKMRAQAIEEYKSNVGTTEGPTMRAETNGTVVAVVYGVDADGVAYTRLSTVDDPREESREIPKGKDTQGQSAKENREQAETFSDEELIAKRNTAVHDNLQTDVEEVTQKLEDSESDLSTDYVEDKQNLDKIKSVTDARYSHPYGTVQSDADMYKNRFYNDDEGKDNIVYACNQDVWITPGYNAYDSSYRVTKWNDYQKWIPSKTYKKKYPTAVGDALHLRAGSYAPMGAKDDSTYTTTFKPKLSVSTDDFAIDFGVNFSHTVPPASRRDLSAPNRGWYGWQYNVKWDSETAKSTQVAEQSGLARISELNSGSDRIILETTDTAEMEAHTWWDNVELNMDIYDDIA